MAAAKPDYVIEFSKNKPSHTEIKCINGHYYLYECFSRYDPINKKAVKISGRMLGKITPNGFVKCEKRRERRKSGPTEFEKYMENAKEKGPIIVPPINNSEVDNQFDTGSNHSDRSENEPNKDKMDLNQRDESEVFQNPLEDSNNNSHVDECTHCNETEMHNSQCEEQNNEKVPETDQQQFNEQSLDNFGEAYSMKLPHSRRGKNVEIGATLCLYNMTEDIRKRLKESFSEDHFWVMIYSICLLRTIYGPRFRRLKINYESSITSYIYPNIPLDRKSISEALEILGQMRECMEDYMKKSISPDGVFALLDGHRLISTARDMPAAELGYDSKRRHKRQINVLYLYMLTDNKKSYPAYYKQYSGGTIDIQAILNMQKEIDFPDGDITIVGDKGCASEEEMKEFENKGLKYVFPLKRGNRYVKDRVPAPNSGEWDTFFTFNRRAILAKSFCEGDKKIHLFYDCKLFSEEMASLAMRFENNNNAKSEKLQKSIKQKEADVKKKERIARNATAARERAEKRFEKAEEAYERAHRKVENLQADFVEASLKARLKREGSKAYIKANERCENIYSQLVNAQGTEQRRYVELEQDKALLEGKKTSEISAINDANGAKETLNILIALSEKKSDYQSTGEFASDYNAAESDIEQYFPRTVEEALACSKEAGTITLITNRTNDSAERIYTYFKQRNNIEKFFDTYDNTLNFDASYMHNGLSFEAWLFLNHVCSEMTVSLLNTISMANKTKDYSFKDVITILRNISAGWTGNDWIINPIKEATKNFCSTLNLDIESVLYSFNWKNYKSNNN